MRLYPWERRASPLSFSNKKLLTWFRARRRPCAFFVLAALLAAGVSFGPGAAKTSGQIPRTVKLEGRCEGPRGGEVPPGTMVMLQTMEGEIAAQQPLDSSGAFEISELRKIRYLLIVKANGFKPYQQEIDLGLTSDVHFVDITLTPISTVVRRPPPALTDLQAPKEARKAFARGRQALEQKNAKKAERFLESAVKIYPCYARAQTDLGLTLSTLGKFGNAEEALRKAIACDPGFLESYTMLGQLLNAEKHYTMSEAVLEKGLTLSPGAWQFYAELGTAEFGQGKYLNAAEQFQKAEQMTPGPPADIHVKLANAYVKMRSFNQAYGEMAAYLNADPGGPLAPRIKEIMGQMKAAGVIHSSSGAVVGP